MFIKFEPVINTIKFLTEIPFNSTSEAELPSDMRFNSAHVISIVGYGTLFVVSSIANLVIVLFNIIEVKTDNKLGYLCDYSELLQCTAISLFLI